MAVHQVRRKAKQFKPGDIFKFRSMRGREGTALVLEVREYAARPLYCRWVDSSGAVRTEDFHPSEFMFTKEVQHERCSSKAAA